MLLKENDGCVMYIPAKGKVYNLGLNLSGFELLANSGNLFLLIDSLSNLQLIDAFSGSTVKLPPLEDRVSTSSYTTERLINKDFQVRELFWVYETNGDYVVAWYLDAPTVVSFCKKGSVNDVTDTTSVNSYPHGWRSPFSIAVTRSGEVLVVKTDENMNFRIFKNDFNPKPAYIIPPLLEVHSLGDDAIFLDLGITTIEMFSFLDDMMNLKDAQWLKNSSVEVETRDNVTVKDQSIWGHMKEVIMFTGPAVGLSMAMWPFYESHRHCCDWLRKLTRTCCSSTARIVSHCSSGLTMSQPQSARMLLRSLGIIGATIGIVMGIIGTTVLWLFPRIFTQDKVVISENSGAYCASMATISSLKCLFSCDSFHHYQRQQSSSSRYRVPYKVHKSSKLLLVSGVDLKRRLIKDYEELTTTVMSIVDRVVNITRGKIDSSTNVLNGILRPVVEGVEEITWHPLDPYAINQIEKGQPSARHTSLSKEDQTCSCFPGSAIIVDFCGATCGHHTAWEVEAGDRVREMVSFICMDLGKGEVKGIGGFKKIYETLQEITIYCL
ncbi:unnamed protein product [Cochlearia groenlandica]